MSSRFFSSERINTGRQSELDLLKALCVFGMIFVHVFLDLGHNVVPSVIDDYLTEFFGAATFMICMGIGMCYMRRQTPKAYLVRGFGLLTIGQFLNILRNSIPNLIAWWITGKQFFIANALLILQSDILTFAGLAFLTMALLKKFRLKGRGILCAGLVLSLVSLILWNTVSSPKNYLVSQMAGFFIITDAEAYFPLFCYFIFAAFGYFIGEYYPRILDKRALANRIMQICFPAALAYYVLRFLVDMPFMPVLGSDVQYNMKPTPDAIATCIFTLGILGLLARFMELLDGKLPPVVQHFAKYINNYYCLHYLFVLPVQTILIAVTGHLMTGKIVPILYGIFVAVACYFIIEMNEKHWHIHFATLRGAKMIAFTAAVWIATVAITAYAYPRIEVFANVWNDYLLP